MTALASFDTPITEPGEYSFPRLDPGSLFVVIFAVGSIGSSGTLGYLSSGGGFEPMLNASGSPIVVTEAGTASVALEVRIPPTGYLAVKIEGGETAIAQLMATRCLP